MNSIEHYLQNIYLNAQPPSKKVSEHECIRLLWIKVILRAAYDWVLYRNSRSHISKKIAEDAYRWLFNPPKEKITIIISGSPRTIEQQEFNSLENICDSIDLDVDSVRKFARVLTRDAIKKMEFLDRSTKVRTPRENENENET